MTIVVSFAPDGRGRAVLHMAGMLARSSGDDLLLSAVIPAPWPPSPARVDAEYQAYLERTAEEALEQARGQLPGDIPARTVVRHARSAPAGLVAVAEEHDAALLAAGSSSTGSSGTVSLGSTTSRLLHSSPIPVALAPRAFRCRPDARVTRVTAAFSEGAEDLVIAAAGVAARVGASLRLASFAVRSRPPYTSGVGTAPEAELIAQWTEEIREAGKTALAKVADLPAAPVELEAVIGHGETWEEALDRVEWEDGDVLVVGSSSVGPIARVFIGSRASKIVRHSPVPVVVVPRGRAAELAEEAMSISG
jgi:nucleotide-binding universal stress UspA family protein